ncbi:MAG: hypothetical protein KA310_03440 [Pseudomonadales bacterium]|nr:hypothetical protein [Pseudomonadales bacterium]
MKVNVLDGYDGPEPQRRGGTMKLGTAARACKGKKKGAFRACIKSKMRGGGKKRRSRRSRR